ncbi:hypothetical protein [Oligoflexus tunisiensis]|uniref:hypothetical protein n=1 Tax=Oligoflexus tunisiensis TaxID=708132 RepID=UPI00114CE054|nr:hypothetical protein [Oligoflexus tunisiensis]
MVGQLSLVTALFLLTSACATKVDGLQVSDSFQPSTLKSGALVTGGVVDTKAGVKREDSNTYSALMLSEIKDEREYVSVKPVETLIQALGDSTYNIVLNQYSKSGLDGNTLGQIAEKLPGVRFVALAKIEGDTTEKGENRQAASETKNDDGKVIKTPASVTKTHKRTVLASMHIYDLKNRDVAFSGQVSKSKETSRNYTINTVGNVLSVVNAIQGKDDDATYPTPEAPSTRDVLAEVFEGFAENFPKE